MTMIAIVIVAGSMRVHMRALVFRQAVSSNGSVHVVYVVYAGHAHLPR